jgi:hypothetical protein
MRCVFCEDGTEILSIVCFLNEVHEMNVYKHVVLFLNNVCVCLGWGWGVL